MRDSHRLSVCMTSVERAGRPSILSVIVSYNGHSAPVILGRSLLNAVDHVLIVDNGSDAESLSHLGELRGTDVVTVQELGENKGIGHALNLGVAKAKELRCEWLLTMDQDSVIDERMVEAYRRFIREHPEATCLSPNIVTARESAELTDTDLEYAITSGNLVKVSLFDEVGQYNEALFIDSVDLEFSLRVRRAGHRIVRVKDAVLRHHVGDQIQSQRALSRFYLHHSPLRRYYAYRNHLFLVRAFAKDFPLFILKATMVQALLLIAIFVYDDEPRRSMSFIARGIRDFVAGRMGSYRG